jgi:hypothetical protein
MISFIAVGRIGCGFSGASLAPSWRQLVAMLVDPFSHEAKRAAGQRTGDHLAPAISIFAESPA